MNVNKRYFLFLLLWLLPITVKAECNYQRKAELNKIASNVRVSYSYEVDENQRPVYSVHLTNIVDEIYVVDMFGNEYRNGDNLVPVDSLYLHIYSNDPSCSDEISQLTINLPTFNEYSKLPECQGNGNALCNMWQDTSLYDEATFKRLVTLKDDETEETTIVEEEDDEFNLLYIFVGSIFLTVVVGGIILFIRMKRKIK